MGKQSKLKVLSLRTKIILYSLIAIQMGVWAWIQSQGGQLPDKHYLFFCAGMMLGQIATSIECIFSKVWGTLAIQIYFFIFTGYGGITRYLQMIVHSTG